MGQDIGGEITHDTGLGQVQPRTDVGQDVAGENA